MNKVKLSSIFDIKYGNSLDLFALEICEEGDENAINFVSRTRENNGVSACVKLIDNIAPFEAGLITVAGSGNSVLESSVQLSPFYTGFHVFILKPRRNMTILEKLFYCHCIRQNRYKYSFGRQANKTLKDILIPSEMPTRFKSISLDDVISISLERVLKTKIELNKTRWRYFKLEDLFEITGSATTSLLELQEEGEGNFPYVTTQATNNGVAGFYNKYTEFGNILTIDSAVLGYCSYQPVNFSASDHVEKLIPKFIFNQYVAMFLVTVLNLEQYRYNYGRKACQTRLKSMIIKLPSKGDAPDWEFMEAYIKSLPFSKEMGYTPSLCNNRIKEI